MPRAEQQATWWDDPALTEAMDDLDAALGEQLTPEEYAAADWDQQGRGWAEEQALECMIARFPRAAKRLAKANLTGRMDEKTRALNDAWTRQYWKMVGLLMNEWRSDGHE